LLNQASMLVAQTLELEFCQVLELLPDGQRLRLRAGLGWREGYIGKEIVAADNQTQSGFTLTAGEPVVVENFTKEKRFAASPLLKEHLIMSGVTVAIAVGSEVFGVLGAHSTRKRVFTEDEVHFLLAVATVLAMAIERNRSIAEMQKLASFAQLNPNPAIELSVDGAISYSNEAAQKLATSVGQAKPDGILPGNISAILESCLTKNGGVMRLESQLGNRNFSWLFHPVQESKVVHAYVEDITERLELEAQLRQSQKMESVGQLAAGVAHDFNNMLTVIQGHAGMLIAGQSLPPSLLDSVQAIYFAAERAANLTRQLLMFSRKNVMQLKLHDLREIVSNMSKMLQRLLSEAVRLEFEAPAELPLVQADAGMLEQVLMNLAVNARDAMLKGGMLNVSLLSIEIDEHYVQTHPESRTGPFVRLRVSDNGSGMDEATMARIFEPFFTTKEVGKGTGLGLATVYGIVKQHGGWIEVSSTIGRGTTFDVFFPAGSEPVPTKDRRNEAAAQMPGGAETILIVEDEPVLREMAHLILSNCGYRVLEASSGVQALRLWERHGNAIDLVVTDMVMPEGMSGMELAEKLHTSKPDVKIIFASGYSMDNLDTSFVRSGHAGFLQKPYTHVTLANAVREYLDK